MKKILSFILLYTLALSGFAQTKDLNKQEKQYLDFLYQYMPLSDRADYDTSFFISQVKTAIMAKNTFSWGKIVPEEIFKHFVLVYRVNNENLDSAREVMFSMMKDRIKNMSMYDAALEVNHWCHEYVNYKGSDGRTSSPLATMKTSWGRCGEESTFAVTALRSVGIPARQCYTPRWAHTDDNHAWVEVWIEGKWYFLGACEPEPKLNVAWFTAPAKRAMMVHSTVFGKYNGNEETNYSQKLYSKINLLSNYAPTKKLNVKVVDEKGKAIKDANVSFGLYNYAEYYPLATIKTNSQGVASLTTGIGDLMIWAEKDNLYNQQQAFAKDKDITITIKKNALNEVTNKHFTLTPPIELPIETIDSALIKQNGRRIVYEDSIRNSYIATFPDSNKIEEFCNKVSMYDKKDVKDVIFRSCGNYKEIEKVLLSKEPFAMNMLKMVYDKDLRDVESSVLIDHLKTYNNSNKSSNPSEYILNPRIALEKITPWRSFLRKSFIKQEKDFTRDPQNIAKWINNNIKVNNSDNYYGVPISPKGILKIKQADKTSIEILFVAICRTFNIESRYEWATGRSQYRLNSRSAWQYAFKENKSQETNNCLLIVNNDIKNSIKPEYYSQFTIQKLENSYFKTLDYEYDPHFLSFPDSLYLSQGEYRIVAGNRYSSGKVEVNETYFSLKPNTTKTIQVTIPELTEKITTIGKINLNQTKQVFNENKQVNIQSLSNNKPMVVAVIDPYKEPSRHLLVDISKSKDDFDKQATTIVFVLDKSLVNDDFSLNTFPPLPKNTIFVLDENKTIEKQIIKATNLNFLNNYPILTLINNDEDIVYLSQGYRISSQEEILKTIKRLK
ncbi:MAG: transglutaminase-like domain-containing protein [Bacteroidales bacterium]|jgi:transglutaminase-like putative cysteine protease|nr:transglutaminase-like domain-containing protein [Bacteroidales bacterium]